MKFRFRKLLSPTMLAAALLSPQLHADDIDLYTGGEAATGAAANVLIVTDNSAAWNANNQGWPDGKQGYEEYQALAEIAGTLGDNINVGLGMFAGEGGGYIRFGIREMNGTNRPVFQGMLNNMADKFLIANERGDDQVAQNSNYDSAMNGYFRYFNGKDRFLDGKSGTDLDLRDYNGNMVSPSRQPAFAQALGAYPLADATINTYSPPSSVAGGCAKNFVIFIGQKFPNQTGSTAELEAAAGLIGISDSDTLTAITTPVPGGSPKLADEWARFMYTYGVKTAIDDPKSTTTPKAKLINKIATYTIDVCKDQCDPDQATLLKSMAKVGGGKYFKSTTKAEIKNALALIFAEIQAVNSVFASATLPISVNTQGTYENQVYIGVFRPDAGSRPRWFGNLKEYKFGRYCDADRNDKVLIDSTRSLVNGMIPATLTGNATGTVTGVFTGTLTDVAGTATAVSGNVSGTVSGTASATLAATLSTSAGTTANPTADAGSGTVTGTITGTGTGTGTSTFTGTFSATPSISGTFSASDERVGDDVPAPDCGSDGTGKIPLKLYMGDKNGYRAIDEEGNTGFIDLSAKSYWTSASSFWTFQPTETGSTSDSPDGPSVERGAAAQRLRTRWGETATSPHPDGRKLYTCLGNCLLSTGSAAEKTLSNNSFTTTNSAVTAALAAPSGAASVTLARSGNIVTATSSTAHGFNDTDSVVIAGATPTAYNGTKTITYLSSTTFSYPLTETPAATDTVTAATLGATTATTGSLSGTRAAGTTSTVTLAAPTGLTNGAMTAEISGASLAVLNGVKAGTVTGGVFTYDVALPANPSATLAGTATVKCGTNASETATGTWSSATGKFTFAKSGTGNYSGCRGFSGSVLVSGASDAAYNGTWTIAATDKGNASFQAGTLAAQPAVAATYAMSITAQGTTYTGLPLTRTPGSQTVTVSSGSAMPAISNGATVQISNATDTSYNANWTVSSFAGDQQSFTFTGPALGPTTPATGTITATSSAATVTGPTTANLINWMRGKDLWEDENYSGTLTDVRASIHGDVLHARPVVVNYGNSIGIIGFYGSNDGYLRAIHGGTSSVDGEEKWAFIPSEFMNYSRLSRLYGNSELVRYPNSACSITPAPTARNYFWDGPMTAYQSPDGTASTPPSKTWLFATMRRGGRAIYAIDVTNPDTPKFMWRITNATAGFSELGQTWSEPKVTKLKGSFTRADTTVITDPVVLVFGAGYDAAQEDKPTGSMVTPTMGRGVFVVEAETGQLIQFLNPTTISTTPKGYSFAADVNVIDLNADGYADRIYAGDTNANIFRFDTVQSVANVASSSYWKRYHIAKVGDTDNNGGANARKFLFQPEILPFTHNGVVKAMVLVGSGNREKPLNNFKSDGSVNTLSCSALYSDTYFSTASSNKVNDRFFGLLDAVQTGDDEATMNADPIVLSDLQQVNSNTVTTTALTPFSLSSSERGWQILLRNDPDGNGARNEEKTVNAARVVAGTVFFATNTPVSPNTATGVCTNLGEALGYAIDPFTGLPAINRDASTSGAVQTYTSLDYATKFSGGGLPPTVTAGVVSIGGTPYRFIIGSGGETLTSASSIAGARSVITLTGTRTRLYWSYGAD